MLSLDEDILAAVSGRRDARRSEALGDALHTSTDPRSCYYSRLLSRILHSFREELERTLRRLGGEDFPLVLHNCRCAQYKVVIRQQGRTSRSRHSLCRRTVLALPAEEIAKPASGFTRLRL